MVTNSLVGDKQIGINILWCQIEIEKWKK